MARIALVIALLCALYAGPAWTEIYRWTDAEGKLHFTQDLGSVPPAHREQAAKPSATAASASLQTFDTPPASIASDRAGGSRGVIRIPFERRGTLMWVDAVVNDRHRIPFLIDTGASGVSLPSEVVAALGIPIRSDTPRVTVSTANGLTRVPLVELDSVQLGAARVEGLQATVNPTMSVGLLGGSFFNNYKYSVDAAASTITLEPNDGVRGGAAADQWRERFQTLQELIDRLETYLAEHPITRANQRREREGNLAALKEDMRNLDLEANRARVPKAWRH
jgi:aspartyl protease family protein